MRTSRIDRAAGSGGVMPGLQAIPVLYPEGLPIVSKIFSPDIYRFLIRILSIARFFIAGYRNVVSFAGHGRIRGIFSGNTQMSPEEHRGLLHHLR